MKFIKSMDPGETHHTDAPLFYTKIPHMSGSNLKLW